MQLTLLSRFMKHLLLSILLLTQVFFLSAQETSTDTSQTLAEVTVKAFEQNRKLMQVPAAIAVITKSQLLRFNNTSVFINKVTGPFRDSYVNTPEFKITAVRLVKLKS